MNPAPDRKAWLEARLATIESRMRRIEEELDMPADPDVEERAVEREADEVLERLGLSARDEARMIRAALSRIGTPGDGVCTRCGKAIAPPRLAALPWTPFCRDCAP